MSIDLAAAIMLLAGLLAGGQPDEINWTASVGVQLAYGSDGTAVAVVVGVDPTPIRYRPSPALWGWDDYTCGLSDGYNVWVLPDNGCSDTLTHELTHIRQRQALGWLGVGIARAAGLDLEADPVWTSNDMLYPHGLNYPLLRITIPLQWERTP